MNIFPVNSGFLYQTVSL